MQQNNYKLYRYFLSIQTTELVFGLLWMNKFTIKNISFHDKFQSDNGDSQVHNILSTNFFRVWRLLCFSPTLFSSNSYELKHCMSKTGLKWLVLRPGFYKALIRSSIYFHWFMLWKLSVTHSWQHKDRMESKSNWKMYLQNILPINYC